MIYPVVQILSPTLRSTFSATAAPAAIRAAINRLETNVFIIELILIIVLSLFVSFFFVMKGTNKKCIFLNFTILEYRVPTAK